MEQTCYRTEPTTDGRFAVVHGAGEKRVTLAVFHGEDAAITAAAALNGGPVRSVATGGRWDEKMRNAECGTGNEEQAA